eukprot:246648_1
MKMHCHKRMPKPKNMMIVLNLLVLALILHAPDGIPLASALSMNSFHNDLSSPYAYAIDSQIPRGFIQTSHPSIHPSPFSPQNNQEIVMSRGGIRSQGLCLNQCSSNLSSSRTTLSASILRNRRSLVTSPSQLNMAFFADNSNNDEEDEFDNNEEDSIDNVEGEGYDDEDEEVSLTSEISVDQAREQLEDMMSIPKDNYDRQEKKRDLTAENGSSDSDMSAKDAERYNHILATRNRTIRNAVLSNYNSPPPLTAILRERRLKEMQLLSTLTHSDEAISELWALWIAERGPTAASTLLHAEELMSIESWDEAEQTLLTLVEDHGIHWAEPVNRLATLYYMLQEYEESRALCELVLDTKPWHFGALSGIVLVCTAMNDASGAKEWAELRLPPLFNSERGNFANGPNVHNERRSAWTKEALARAEESMKEASLVGRNRDIGQEEMEFRNFRAKLEEQTLAITPENDCEGERADKNTLSGDDDERSYTSDAWQ